jgi:hypothetical protein
MSDELPLVLREVGEFAIGEPLTNAQVDYNFLTLRQGILDTSSYLNSNFYNKSQVDGKFSGYYTTTQVDSKFSGYYTTTQVDSKFSGYYTASQVDSKLAGLSTGGSGSSVNLSNYYTISQIDGKFTQYYTKSQVDSTLAGLSTGGGSVDLSNYYTKPQIDSKLLGLSTGGSVDLSNYYTTTQVDGKFSGYYTASQVDSKLAGLSTGGGSVDLSNYYTKSETDGKFVNSKTTTYTSGYSTSYVNSISDNVDSLRAIYQYQSYNDSAHITKSIVATGDVSAAGAGGSGGLYGSGGLFFGGNAIKAFGRFYGNGVAFPGAYNLFGGSAPLTITTFLGDWVYAVGILYGLSSNSTVVASCSGLYTVNCAIAGGNTIWVSFRDANGASVKLQDDQSCCIIVV